PSLPIFFGVKIAHHTCVFHLLSLVACFLDCHHHRRWVHLPNDDHAFSGKVSLRLLRPCHGRSRCFHTAHTCGTCHAFHINGVGFCWHAITCFFNYSHNWLQFHSGNILKACQVRH